MAPKHKKSDTLLRNEGFCLIVFSCCSACIVFCLILSHSANGAQRPNEQAYPPKAGARSERTVGDRMQHLVLSLSESLAFDEKLTTIFERRIYITE